jgi:thermitase
MRSTHVRVSASLRRCSGAMVALAVMVGLVSGGAIGPVGAESRTAVRTPHGAAYRTDEVLVRFRAGLTAAAQQGLNRAFGTTAVKVFTIVPNLQLVRLPRGLSVDRALAMYRQRPEVMYAQPNWLYHLTSVDTQPDGVAKSPNDPRYGEQWAWPKIDAPDAWDVTTGSRQVVVTDIDTGFDYTHEDLAANAWHNTAECDGVEGKDDDGNGYVDDCYGIDTDDGDSDPAPDPTGGYRSHGTHTGGTMGAVGNNGVGVTGFSWKVSVMPCKSHGGDGVATPATIIECFQYAAMEKQKYGYNVVATNNSYGGCTEACDYDPATKDGIAGLWKAQILFIAAAGNSNSNNDTTPAWPANYFLPNVIAVAATTSADGRAGFSSYGSRTVAVGAPGVGILSTVPGNAYGLSDGTSMATPHVTGLAGLLASAGGLDWIAIRNLLISGGDPIAALDGVTVSGRRINAFGSIQCGGSGHAVFGLLRPLPAATGGANTVAALNIDCEAPAGGITATVKPGNVKIALKDNGTGGDLQKHDGIYSATWTPCDAKAYTLSFAGGASYPVTVSGPTPCIALDPKSGPPGSKTTVSGTGFAAGEQVRLTFDKKVLSTVTADSKGAFSTKITVPGGAKKGAHTIRATGDQTALTVKARFTVR